MALWLLLKSKTAAFTMMEAIITLGLVSLLLAITAINYQQQLSLQQEKIALINFEYNWKQTLKTSFLNNASCVIHFDNQKQQIRYQTKNHFVVQILPESLHFTTNNSTQVIKINSADAVAPQTIRVNSKLNQRTYRYTVQMGWGRLLEK